MDCDESARSCGSSRCEARKAVSALIAVGAFTAAVFVVVIWLVVAAQTIPGTPTINGRSHHDRKFPTVHAVSGVPTGWIATVCKPYTLNVKFGAELAPNFLFLYPNTVFHLPRSETSATCSARYQGASDPVVLIAEYVSEDLMQLDLAENGIQWYCFAAVDGRLFVMATRAEERVMGANGLSASPTLAPLVHDGFLVYSDPGR